MYKEEKMRRIGFGSFAVLLLLLLGGACSEPDAAVATFVNDGTALGQPEVVLSGPGAAVYEWPAFDRLYREVLFESADGLVRVRSFFDPLTGDLRMFRDEITGEYTVILQNDALSPTEFLYLTYNASNSYQSGYAAFVVDDRLKLGRIVGQPAFSGQIIGQLVDGRLGQTGSFAVVAANEGDGDGDAVALDSAVIVDDVQDVDEAVLELANAIATVDTLSPSLAGESSSRAAIRVSGLLPKTLKIGGAIMFGVGLAAHTPALAAAGICTVVAGLASNDIADFIENNFETDAPMAQTALNLLVDVLRDKDSSGLIGSVRKAVDIVEDVIDGVVDVVESSADFDPVDSAGTIIDSNSEVEEADQSVLPIDPFDSTVDREDLAGVPSDDAEVEGQGVWQDGTTYDLSGTVMADGSVSVSGPDIGNSGDSMTITGQVDQNGSFSGQFDSGEQTGTASGTMSELGDCSQSQGSGGEGTFTFTHSVGQGPGTVSFYYDAYSIPDAFTVTASGGTLFSTGGLVSGSQSVSLSIPAGSALVFVSVSAPRSGTGWEYSVGCIE